MMNIKRFVEIDITYSIKRHDILCNKLDSQRFIKHFREQMASRLY
jgi:hypothetical protein